MEIIISFFLGFFIALLFLIPRLALKLKHWTRRLAILILALVVSIEFVGLPLFLNPPKAQAAVPAGVIVAWPSTNGSIPAGWTRVTALDSRFVKEIATSGTNPGTTGGSATHDHPLSSHQHNGVSHTHSGGQSGESSVNTATDDFGTNSNTNLSTHTHTITYSGAEGATAASAVANFGSGSSDPAHLAVIFIKSDGTPTGIPNNALAFFNGAAPSGWAAHASSADRFWKGAAAGGDGGATGTGSHSHAGVSHTHAAGGGSHSHSPSIATDGAFDFGTGAGSGTLFSHESHSHSSGGNSGSTADSAFGASTAADVSATTIVPPWQKLLPIENTSGGASQPNNLIAIWDGTLASIPSGWKLCDGVNCTANLSQDKFVRGAANSGEVGTTGGASTHTHIASASHSHTATAGHTHAAAPTTGNPTSTKSIGASGSVARARDTHTHTMPSAGSATSTTDAQSPGSNANSSNDPTFTGVAYIQSQNTTPNAPTIMGSSPIAGSKPDKGRTTISLQANATDPDVADTVQVEWDYSSNSGGGWTNIGTTTLGAQGIHTLSWNASGLTPLSTYRLRARTIDNGGAQSSYTTQASDWTLTSGCGPPPGGDLIIAVSCAFAETVDGVDNGNITINTSITLTVNAGQTVGFNSGKTISVNGAIAINDTGVVKKSNIWMVDADSDGWPATVTQTIQDSSPGGTYRRRNLLQSDRIIDCNDAVLSATNEC